MRELSPRHIIIADIIASISYIFNLAHGVGNVDDIDHFGNRRLRSVGELLQNQFRIGLSRMERVVRTYDDTGCRFGDLRPRNIRPVSAAIEFFQQFSVVSIYGQTNPGGIDP